jgi:hypothetical protein
MDGGSMQVLEKSGERGRNRTYNLLIKSYVARCGYGVDNCSRHNNLTIKRPAWTVFKSVGKVGEIERHLIAKDTKRTQPDQHGWSEHNAAAALVSMALPMSRVRVLC